MKKIIPLLLAAIVVTALALCHRYYGASDADEQKGKPSPLWENPSFTDLLKRSGTRGLDGMVIVAPSSGIKEEDLEQAREIADTLGLSLPENAIAPGRVPYTANDDETRFALLADALNDSETEVLWAFRGGYGSSRLLSRLAAMPEPSTRKIVVGYSDMTFLHLMLQRWDWPTVHGSMFWELPSAGDDKSEENFLLLGTLLAGERTELRYAGLKPRNDTARDAALPVRGVLRGGNLTCLAAAAGTPWSVDAEGAVLFIEDVKERGYKLDRMLTQLRLAGIVDKATAVVLGEFTKGDDDVEFALERFARECGKPVFATDLFGHGEKNYPLAFNCPAVVEKGATEEEAFVLRIDATPLFATPEKVRPE